MAQEHYVKNPVEWGADRVADTAHALARGAAALHMPQETAAQPVLRKIDLRDIRDALMLGAEDLGAFRTDIYFLAIIYPLAALVLGVAATTNDLLPLIFPLASGFALVGPVAAIGLYQLSRRREKQTAGAGSAEPARSYGAMALVGALLATIFVVWLAVAYGIYAATLGPEAPQSTLIFLQDVFTTAQGWTMIVLGVGVGFLFAAVAFAIGVISFPLMLDREVGPATAMRTSLRAVQTNPGPMAVWGVIVVAGLVLGALPALIGLVVVIPVLGHATWHLYRKLVVD